MTTHHVYHLVDPTDHAIRYVGKTTHPKARLRAHIKDAQESQTTEKKRWISGLIAQGLQPVMVIVATHSDEATARIHESQQVKQHLATVYNLHDPAKGAKDLKRGDEQ